MQNSGVIVEVKSMYFSNSKDKNPIFASRAYFGIIEKILEIGYVLFIVPLFKCKWFGNNIDVQTDELGFIQVEFGKTTYMTKPIIMAIKEKQVFYVNDNSDKR